MTFDYDLFVIGGGSGGVRAARIAAGEHGVKVGLAEEYRMGGTCVIRGCVPKKLMVFASAFPGAIEDAVAYGWQVTRGAFDWTAFRAKLDAELDRLEGLYRKGLFGAGVDVHDCRATVVDAHSVRLADGTVKTAKHILVAVGGRPFVPAFPGSELVATSNDVFKLDRLPGRMLIVGGGYIACEFACIMAGLGVSVVQYQRSANVLKEFDAEARDMVVAGMLGHGIDLRCGVEVTSVAAEAEGFRVVSTDGRDELFDLVVHATGRVPNTDGLGLEAAGVALKKNGAVEVDGWSQTGVPSIYAVGDVTDRIQLTPVAIREGHALADTLFGGRARQADHELVASAVFTQPELASCGITEEQAAKSGEAVEVYTATFRPMKSLFAGREDKVLMKLLVGRDDRRVLGCHIVAPEAGEMIQLAAIAMKMGATKEDFDRTCAVHPTMSEELVTMRKPSRVVGAAG